MTQPFGATRLSAAEAAAKISHASEVERRADATIGEARAMIDQALREAEAVRDLVARESARRDDGMRRMADKTVDRYLDGKRIEAEARAAATLIEAASAVRREFEALTPWLTEFLRTGVERVIGRLDDADLLSRVVAECVADMRDARALTLRVHPDALERMEAARAAHPLRFEAVTALRADARLRREKVILDGAGGVTDASIATQVDLLCRALEVEA